MNLFKKLLLKTLRKYRTLPSKFYAKIHYEYHTGKKLDLENPKEFNEKIQWYKVFYRPQILNQLVDKYAVRSYVEEKIGSQYLNKVYGVYTKAEDIPFNSLPNKFVVKATHASGYNLIVTNKQTIDKPKTLKLFNKWLSKNQYYRMGQEWAYKDVPPRLIVEEYLKDDERNDLIDYKFYCFNGIAKFIDVHVDREEDHQQGCFDLDFNILPFGKSNNYKSIYSDIKKPSNLNEMVSLSETLAEKFPFVRVDFYSLNGKAIFGEMTFYPSDARKDFTPDKYNKIIGDYFEIPKLKKGEKTITDFN